MPRISWMVHALCAAVVCASLASAASAAVITLDKQERYVTVEAGASLLADQQQGDYDSHNATAADAAPFDPQGSTGDALTADAAYAGGWGSGEADQTSTISTTLLEATGYGQVDAGADADTTSHGRSGSIFRVDFTLDEESTWSLTGSIAESGGASSEVYVWLLHGTEDVLYASADGTARPISERLSLGGGQYSLMARARLYTGAHPEIPGVAPFSDGPPGTGEYCVRFELVPEPATLGLLAMGGLAVLRRRCGR